MLSKTTKLIFKAITIEIIGAILIASFFYAIFFGLQETIQILQWLYIPIIMGSVLTYAFGWFIGNCFSANYPFKIWQGVVIMFALLLVGILGSMFSLSLSSENDVSGFLDFTPVILVFLIFGGLPTLILGLWLGNQLKRNRL